MAAATPPRWYVYIVRCAGGTLYTGVARDVQRRVEEHNTGGPRSAKYTRPRRPVTLAYVKAFASRSAASRREHEIKKLSRARKLELIQAAGTPKLWGRLSAGQSQAR
ncbi:MAG: GIY-YIG nuclease family protein [Gammaproteobacteria bacterium]|nr:GIY-YIG nuclease family protein [Gammaproteobacteria bacterium]